VQVSKLWRNHGTDNIRALVLASNIPSLFGSHLHIHGHLTLQNETSIPSIIKVKPRDVSLTVKDFHDNITRSAVPYPLLNHDAVNMAHAHLEFDRLGVIFEYRGFYFTITPALSGNTLNANEGVYRGWVTKDHLDVYSLCTCKWDTSPGKLIGLLSEWESVPKIRFGENCIAATGSTSGWWHVHSQVVMSLRTAIAVSARNLEQMRQHTKIVMPDQMFRAMLAKEFSRVVDAVYGILRVKGEKKKEALRRQAESAMNEFTTLGR
jgi:hypothetical protein